MTKILENDAKVFELEIDPQKTKYMVMGETKQSADETLPCIIISNR